MTLTVPRRRSCLCDYLPCLQDPSHPGPQVTAGCRLCLGWDHSCCLLLPSQCLPHQERRISILAAAFLKSSWRAKAGNHGIDRHACS